MKKVVFSLPALCAVVCLFVGLSAVQADETCPKNPPKTCPKLCPAVDLLKGKSIDDFEFFLADGAKKADVFSICKEGVLSVKGKPFGWLGTKKLYKNFQLTVEFRYPDKNNAINSGIFLRVNGESTMFLPKCVEVQLAPKSLADLYGFWDMKIAGTPERFSVNENHKMTKVLRSVKQFRNVCKKDLTQWQKVEITCFEDMLLVKVNGQVANWGFGFENVEGRIAFQSEGAPVEFRNAFVTEL